MNDRKLIDDVLERRPGAQEELVRRYRDLVIGLCRSRFSLPPDEAEEVLQALVLRLWEGDFRALRAWRGRGRLGTYLTVIVFNLCRKRRRRRALAERVERPVANDAEPADPKPFVAPEERLQRRERLRAVGAALPELSARDRLLLALRYGDEREPVEIAPILGLSPGAARKALHDATRRLRETLRRRNPELFPEPSEEDLVQGLAGQGGSDQ